MLPKKPQSETEKQGELFRIELIDLVNRNHPLVILSQQIPWEDFNSAFEPLYCPDNGRSGIATRLMVGLHYLKHTYGLSDEETVHNWTENPYWQYFCGSKWFEYKFPIDPSTMTRWRKKIGEAGAEEMLAGTIKAGLKGGVIKPSSFAKVIVDTTVQPKAIAYPTDAKLYYKMRENLVKAAKAHDIELRQSYVRLGKRALIWASRYAHARQMRRSRREIRKLKNYLGRVVRDIERKISGDAPKEAAFAEMIEMTYRILAQERKTKNKLYSIHAPETECIAKGKVNKKYEFGAKVGVVTTSQDNFVIGMMALHGNPYDGHTLDQCIKQANRILGRELNGDIFVDLGYRKHDYKGDAKVHIVGRGFKKLTRSLRRWYKRRSAIEPIIGHMKNDGELGRNYLAGVEGDKINAVMCGCGQNMRKLLRGLSFLRFFSSVFMSLARASARINNSARVFVHVNGTIRKSIWKSQPIFNCS